jgi:hypothetical protein
VIAASIEIHGEHLVFLNAEGKTIGAVPGDRPELERAAALICVITAALHFATHLLLLRLLPVSSVS